MFAVQDEITEAIVAAIEPQLYAAENFRAQRKPPESLDAWDLVMRALSHFWRVTREDNIAAQALLEQAIAIDPNYAQALAVLAVSHMLRRPHGLGGRGHRRAGRRTRRRWRRSAPTARIPGRISRSPRVHLYTRRFDDSLAAFELALRLNPNFALAQAIMAWCCPMSGAGRKAPTPPAARCA